jgi:hypothetical protein
VPYGKAWAWTAAEKWKQFMSIPPFSASNEIGSFARLEKISKAILFVMLILDQSYYLQQSNFLTAQ